MAESLEQLLKRSTELLHKQDHPRLEAEILLAHALGKPRSYLHTWPEAIPQLTQYNRFKHLIDLRLSGKPVAYLTGRREFWSLELTVSEATLIPRPETELLVEQTLLLLPKDRQQAVADLGTGSGAIALALAHERPAWSIIATDFSSSALEVARENATQFELANLSLCNSDWCNSFRDRALDAIVSNPPYIAEQDPHLSRGDVHAEPRSALAAGQQGLDDLEKLIHQAPRVLKPGGWLLLEHGSVQAEPVRKLLDTGGFSDIQTRSDLAGLERISFARSHM